MEIKGVTNGAFFVQKTKNGVGETSKQAESKDKIEISTEARDLLRTDLSAERVSEIRKKLADGFYNSEEVLQKVADRISQDLKI